MSKSRSRTVFVCQQCGGQSARWVGRCPDCGAWNSMLETVESTPTSSASSLSTPRNLPTPLRSVAIRELERQKTSMDEFDRVLGGGIVPGSLVLVGGDPGIGKSTLLLQVTALVAEQGGSGPVLYVSGEESAEQVKLRASRLDIGTDALLVLSETDLGQIIEHIQSLSPRLVVIDSIQTMYLDTLSSAAGSVSQVRECAMTLMRLAKGLHIPTFLVGHVTKEGAIAGPRVLEHIVDTVLYLEGERFHTYRVLRSVKNRFGSTNEVGVFEMRSEGMVEVSNPSQAFLSERSPEAAGSAVVVTMEGTRPLLVEVQALTSTTSFGLPRRTGNGVEMGRLLVLSAVLSKRVGLGLSNQDIYVNVVGGLKIGEPAADLGLAAAIASSFRDIPIPADMALIGEVGLAGELRRVTHIDRRLSEAAKLGFRRCLLPNSAGAERLAKQAGIELVGVNGLGEALEAALER